MDDQTPGQITFDTKHMTQTLMHLEDKIGEIKKFGEQLAMSMEGAAVSCPSYSRPGNILEGLNEKRSYLILYSIAHTIIWLSHLELLADTTNS